MAFSLHIRRRSLTRLVFFVCLVSAVRYLFSTSTPAHEIQAHNVLERVARKDKTLDVQRHAFLQARIGRDERDDFMKSTIMDGVRDYWERFQRPFIESKETSRMDAEIVRTSIDDLLSLNGWVAAACSTLTRPFGQNKREDAYADLVAQNHIYYVAIVVSSADHFLVDQLSVIVQMAKRLGTQNIFVSMVDYGSTDATETLTDLCEAVLTLLGIPFRIRRVPTMTVDPLAAYYPLEEAYTRNLALEPLVELYKKRSIEFYRVVWLRGFTCPNDILETIKVSQVNNATMVCGMDWAENNGAFIFSDRWRTRGIDGDQFRQSKSSSASNKSPPRDPHGSARYAKHLPFQAFCCESGTHVVDPSQSYYKGIAYRASMEYRNHTLAEPVPDWSNGDNECMDSSQMWFCRDLWMEAAREPMIQGHVATTRSATSTTADPPPIGLPTSAQAEETSPPKVPAQSKRADKPLDPVGRPKGALVKEGDEGAGSDADAMQGGSPLPMSQPASSNSDVYVNPNAQYHPARILINPRCVTTYAGVSHTQLALHLFGPDKGGDAMEYDSKQYVLDKKEWQGAPDSFVCQEQKETGGRKATKTQRRASFWIRDRQDAR